ncbi:MAG: hypothetical protein ABI634_20075 [Acidobacteriota bacterium]
MAREADCHFSVAIVPVGPSNVPGSTFANTTAALAHHATLASGLRDTGWTLVGYTH